jgi:hypothetical protein
MKEFFLRLNGCVGFFYRCAVFTVAFVGNVYVLIAFQSESMLKYHDKIYTGESDKFFKTLTTETMMPYK